MTTVKGNTMKLLSTMQLDRQYEGLRIPPTLDGTGAVNFVLTQEAGKLKPKDLKAAIEKNRADKEHRAKEQKKIREEGGGGGDLDLRGILADERLNSHEIDPFKRQLREMAFLADLEETDRRETEKEFRISEEYCGSNLLSGDEISIVHRQRSIAQMHQRRSLWRTVQVRNHTAKYGPLHGTIKAGSLDSNSNYLLTLKPEYDPNKNDIWSKRLNTLRRLIALVGKWIIQKRVKVRIKKLMEYFHKNGAYTRDEVLEFIVNENELARKQGKSNNVSESKAKSNIEYNQDTSKPETASAMAMTQPSSLLSIREMNETAAAKYSLNNSKVTSDLIRRVLFPVTALETTGSENRNEVALVKLDAPLQFDDRTVFALKVRPDFITMNYQPINIPALPLYFPPCLDKQIRIGAPEEKSIRPPSGNQVNLKDIMSRWLVTLPTEPSELQSMRVDPVVNEPSDNVNSEDNKSLDISPDLEVTSKMPSWMSKVVQQMHSSGAVTWKRNNTDHFSIDHRVRSYASVPRRCELDNDWSLRPDAFELKFESDSSIRTRLCSKRSGFVSSNVYLLGSHETRQKEVPPPPGPTLSDFFMPDIDRHSSGLYCFSKDHLRSVTEPDHDIAPLQSKQDKADYLTDSDSDNEDEYKISPPSIKKVRQILRAPKQSVASTAAPTAPIDVKGKNAPKGSQPAIAPVPTASAPLPPIGIDDDFQLDDSQRKEEQVELLKDRKTLDLESTLVKQRQKKQETFSTILKDISTSSKCSLQAIPLQLPFHLYEEDAYKIASRLIPDYPSSHVEAPNLQKYGSTANYESSVILPDSPMK
eukprot:gene10290-13833_t